MAGAILIPVSCVVSFCEGWRPVVYGTPTLTQWPVLFYFPVSGVVSFCEGWRPVVYGTPTLTEWPVPFYFPGSGLISRPSEKSRMRCLSQRGRESWDWVEQKSLYKKEFPPRVGGGNFRQNGSALAQVERGGAQMRLLLLLLNVVVS